jgi:hypothetical protein
MDRSKLETVYLRALDALMSAVDEYQIQAAIFRLRVVSAGVTNYPLTQEERSRSRLAFCVSLRMSLQRAVMSRGGVNVLSRNWCWIRGYLGPSEDASASPFSIWMTLRSFVCRSWGALKWASTRIISAFGTSTGQRSGRSLSTSSVRAST